MKHKNDGDTNHIQSTWNNLKDSRKETRVTEAANELKLEVKEKTDQYLDIAWTEKQTMKQKNDSDMYHIQSTRKNLKDSRS